MEFHAVNVIEINPREERPGATTTEVPSNGVKS